MILLSTTLSGQYSGFLEDYPKMKPMKGGPGFIWIAPDFTNRYRAILIEQPEIFIDPNSKYHGVKPDEFKVIADTLRDTLATKLAQHRTIVEEPGPGVARIRLALTHVYMKRGRRTRQPPSASTVYSLRAAVGRDVSLVEATVEAEIVDSVSEKRLGVVVAQRGQRRVKELEVEESPSSWSDLLWTLDALSESAYEHVSRFAPASDEP